MWTLIVLSAIGMEPSQSAPLQEETIVSAPGLESASLSASAKAIRFSESNNFIVRSLLAQPRADQVAEHCETICCELHRMLLGEHEPREWLPKCEVVLHPTQASYLRAVGKGGGQTVGSSAIRIKSGVILQRRVDLLVEDRSRALTGLRHEMVHVIFAELFPNELPPRWADEGFALLQDSDEKQRRHLDDLRWAFGTRTTLPVRRLFATADYPSDWPRAVFYGQSMSTVEYLMSIRPPDHFVRFVQLRLDAGDEHALRTIYQIDDLDELERRWRKHAMAATSRGKQKGSE